MYVDLQWLESELVVEGSEKIDGICVEPAKKAH